MALRGKLVIALAALAAAALLGIWLIPFHHGAEYCGSVLRPAPGLGDADPCNTALSDRGALLGGTVLVLTIAAAGAVAGLVLGGFIRGIRRRRRA